MFQKTQLRTPSGLPIQPIKRPSGLAAITVGCLWFAWATLCKSSAAVLVGSLEKAKPHDGLVSFRTEYSIWVASPFTTGAHPQGYRLDSITGAFDYTDENFYNSSGRPQTFESRIYSDDNGIPGVLLESLTGPQPVESQQYTFDSIGLHLGPDTTYWLTYTSMDANKYALLPNVLTGDFTSNDGWSVGSSKESTDQGISWGYPWGLSFPYAIDATPVPEPHDYAIIVTLTLGGFVFLKRIRGTARVKRA